MKKGTRLTALLLALVMVLGLAACGGGEEDDTQQLSGTVYVPEFMDLKLDTDYVNSGCCDGENVYLLGYKYIEENVEDEDGNIVEYNGYYTYQIYKVDLETKEVSTLENYKPAMDTRDKAENEDLYVDVSRLETGADGTFWVSESCSRTIYDLPEDFDPMTQSRWEFESTYEYTEIRRQLDATGNEISRMDASGITEALGTEYVDSFVTDSQGNSYAMTSSWDEEAEMSTITVTVLDKDMNILFTLKTENWGDLVQLGSDLVAVSAWEENDRVLRTIDLENKDWGKKYLLSSRGGSIYKGSGDYLFYMSVSDALYGCTQADLDAAEVKDGDAAASDTERTILTGTKLFSWSSADINQNNLEFFSFMPDGRVAAMTRDWDYSGDDGPALELAVLTPTDASTLPPRTTLTYACMYCDYDLRSRIIKFNRSNTNCRIEIKDYSEFITDSGEDYQASYDAAIQKLSTEIMAGNVPDLLQTNTLPISKYAGKGMLEDLWTFIDSDPDLGRDKLMVRPLEAASSNGKLYQIFSRFDIRTVAGATKVVGDRMSWTLKDMQEALATMPEGCTYFGEGDTKSGMLQQVMSMSLDRFVDWETGECHFDSPDFISLLEFCNSFPLEYDYSKIDWEEQPSQATLLKTGMQMLRVEYLSDTDYMQYDEHIFGGDFSYIGYPTESGVGSSFVPDSGMAMSSTCKDKEAAWSFMRQMLLPTEGNDRYYYSGFPINKADFDKKMEEAMKVEYETDENGNPILDEEGNPIEVSHGGWWIDGEDLEMKALSQAHYDKLMALYNAIDSIYTYDTEIYDIVNEMAAPYFNGDATVEEIAAQIQGRVNLYVNEKK